ncbi:MAG: [Fe-Fe] hydrogenase large subunit C-terminal domain-containing protein [Halanaerobiales bacterium]
MKKHSVLLKEDKCEGCTNCVKNCPTKAIRVHQGKAKIKEDLCIDCAQCIRTCEYHAKYTETDSLDKLKDYNYPVVLIPPSFYGQFGKEIDVSIIHDALKEIGFSAVYDVAMAAEAISRKTLDFLCNNDGLFISSSCPVIVRLIKLLYPELVDHLMHLKPPVELMAEKVKRELIKNEEKSGEDIGVFFITPCPAKLTAVKNPPAMEKSFFDGAIAVEKVYDKVIDNISKINEDKKLRKDSQKSPYFGIGWGQSGGEEEILKRWDKKNTISVAGISNVKKILDEITRNNLSDLKYLELVACPQGCVGGVLNVVNPFQAKFNIQRILNKCNSDNHSCLVEQNYDAYNYKLDGPFEVQEAGKLDDDFEKAMEKLSEMEKVIEDLPGLDCAACGAPDCETLAEDIVNGEAQKTDCVFMLRKRVGDLADEMSNLAHALPPVMSKKRKEEDNDDN